jgi:hypothetical protein
MRFNIDDTERAILYRNGAPYRWLDPGIYSFWTWGASLKLTRVPLALGFSPWTPEVAALMPRDAGSDVTIEPHQVAVLTLDGKPSSVLLPGRYILWQLRARVQAAIFDTNHPIAPIPEAFAPLLSDHLSPHALSETERGLLILNGKPAAWLTAGKHFAWSPHQQRKVEVRRLNLDLGYAPWTPELAALLPPDTAEEVTIEPHQGAVLRVGGKYTAWLEPGRYLLWQVHKHTQAILYDLSLPLSPLDDAQAKVVPPSHLSTQILADHERALLSVNGKATHWLDPGKHRLWQRDLSLTLRRFDLTAGFSPFLPELEPLLPPDAATKLSVSPDEVALIFRADQLQACVTAGHYLLWQAREPVRAERFSALPLRCEIPDPYWAVIPPAVLSIFTVHPYERGVLYADGKLAAVLDAGRHPINALHRSLRLDLIDLREQELQIAGQEIMTADKVTLRVNLILKFRVTDPVLCTQHQSSLRDSLYSEAQMAVRRFIASSSIDNLLESRLDVASSMAAQVCARASAWGVEVLQLDLKDVILPGDMKHLLNQVIEAEKKASANLITRREEVAATRSQINTARMMDHHPTLMRLKELDVLREVASKIEHLTVISTPDHLLQHLHTPSPPKPPPSPKP